MFDSLDALITEHAQLERQLADPSIHADQERARPLNQRYAELSRIVGAYRQWQQARGDLETARELSREDASFETEITAQAERATELEEWLRRLLVPRDERDSKDVIIEIKAGAGGEEAALFAQELLRMYLRYAERRGWKTEILDATESELGGYKSVNMAVKSRGTPEPDDGVWAWLKYEGGVHRVQRVPITESQGRIHTSAAGVLVLPEADPIEVEIDMNDLRIDAYRSSGPGGQSVNTTDSAIRITHEPTGIVVACQNEKSQLQNKEQALRILRARLYAAALEEAEEAEAAERKSQIRTVDRSERVRTYNFPENRISDHRINYKAYNLDQVLDGALDGVLHALIEADAGAQLAHHG